MNAEHQERVHVDDQADCGHHTDQAPCGDRPAVPPSSGPSAQEHAPHTHPAVVTAVIGAGPAGLLFALVGTLLAQQRGLAPHWRVMLFDKRSEYLRTHQLQIDPVPLRALQRDLAHPLFDNLIQKLEETGFSPPANDLEQWLWQASQEAGVVKRQLAIGSRPERHELNLHQLREHLTGTGDLRPGQLLTIVGADSVQSAVRQLVIGSQPLVRHQHQWAARLNVTGADLPRQLGLLERLHLCRMLGSAVYYRRNGNGFAELDLMLEPDVIGKIGRVRALPGRPTDLGHVALAALGCPQITRIVRYFQDELGQGANQVSLQSTFRLELQYVEQATYPDRLPGSVVFLLGDAAVSLPYFRGMASLTASAHDLAETHCALVDAHLAELGEAAVQSRARQYDQAVRAIRSREVTKVRRRARHAGLLREYGRISALVSSPWQALMVGRERPPVSDPPMSGTLARWAPNTLLNAGLALLALLLVLPLMIAPSPGLWLWWTLGLLTQVLGGVCLRAAPGRARPGSGVRRLWSVQLASLLVLGVGGAVLQGLPAGSVRGLIVAVTWWPMELALIPGIYLYEWLGRVFAREPQRSAA